MLYTWKLDFVLLWSHFLVNISTANIEVVPMLFSQRRSRADEHTLTQPWFSTKYQRWNNIGLSTLNQRDSLNVVTTLFCRLWNNIDKHTWLNFHFQPYFKVETIVIYLCTHSKCKSRDYVTMAGDIRLCEVWRACFPHHKSIIFTLARHKLSAHPLTYLLR